MRTDDLIGIEIGGRPVERADVSPPVAFVVGGKIEGSQIRLKSM